MTLRVCSLTVALALALSATAARGQAVSPDGEGLSAKAPPEPESSPPRCGTLEEPNCSLFWLPMASFLLPGLGQYVDGRRGWPYTVSSAVGLTGTLVTMPQVNVAEPINLASPSIQRYLLFGSLWQTPGFLSSYETYRSRMVDVLGLETRHSSVSEVLMAPARFDRVIRPSVFVPLLLSVGLGALDAAGVVKTHPPFEAYRAGDAPFTAGVSYGAGTGEEAFFRGFLMSYLEHRWCWNSWVANGVQAATFGAAHFDFNPLPLGLRIALGGYLGWVTQSNDYELTDAIFIHTWWDVIQFTAHFASVGRGERPSIFISLPTIVF